MNRAVKIMLKAIKAVFILIFMWVNIPTAVTTLRKIFGVSVYLDADDTFYHLFDSLDMISLWIIWETLFGFWPMLLNLAFVICFLAVCLVSAKIRGVEIEKSKKFWAALAVLLVITALSFDTIIFMPGFW